MSRRAITARYRSECYECGEQVEPGDRVVWESDTGIVWHESCDRSQGDNLNAAIYRATKREVDHDDYSV